MGLAFVHLPSMFPCTLLKLVSLLTLQDRKLTPYNTGPMSTYVTPDTSVSVDVPLDGTDPFRPFGSRRLDLRVKKGKGEEVCRRRYVSPVLDPLGSDLGSPGLGS